MVTTLYCRNLCAHVSSLDLKHLFAGFGRVVSAEVVEQVDSGARQRCGCVEMSSEAEAAAAIRGLNNIRFNGRTMEVAEAGHASPGSARSDSVDANKHAARRLNR